MLSSTLRDCFLGWIWPTGQPSTKQNNRKYIFGSELQLKPFVIPKVEILCNNPGYY